MPCSSSRSARTAMSVHPDPEPRRLGRQLIIRKALLVEPGDGLRDVSRVRAFALDCLPVMLSAADDLRRVLAAFDQRLEFQSRGLFRILVRVPRWIDPPEFFKPMPVDALRAQRGVCSMVCSIC